MHDRREARKAKRPTVSREAAVKGVPSSDQMQEAVELFGEGLAQFLEMTGTEQFDESDDEVC